MTTWAKEPVSVMAEDLIPVRETLFCEAVECVGEMEFNGMAWPTSKMGYHHTCKDCGLTVAVTGKKYPRIVYKSAADDRYIGVA